MPEARGEIGLDCPSSLPVGETLLLVDWMTWFDRMAGEHPRCDEYLGLTLAEVTQQVDSKHMRIVDTNEAEASAAGRTITGIHV